VPYFVLSACCFSTAFTRPFSQPGRSGAHMLLTHVPRAIHRSLSPGWCALCSLCCSLPCSLALDRSDTGMARWARGALGNTANGGDTRATLALQSFLAHFGQYFLYITLWIFPLILGWPASSPAAISPFEPRAAGKPGGAQHAEHADRTAFRQVVGGVIAANVVVFSALGYTFFRYLTHLMPLLLAFLGWGVAWFIARWPVAGYALLLCS